MCSGNGLCFYSGFDGGETTSGETGVPSCACEEGYSGDACEYDLSATTSSSSGVAVTMSESVSLASLFLFIAVFGLTVFACVKREKTISCLSGIINLLQNRQYDDLGPYNNSGRQQSRGGMFSMEFSSDSQTTKKQSSSSRPFHSYTPISEVGDDGYNYSTVPSFTVCHSFFKQSPFYFLSFFLSCRTVFPGRRKLLSDRILQLTTTSPDKLCLLWIER